MMAGSEVDVANLSNLTEELETNAQQLLEEAEEMGLEARIHMERNINDRDDLLRATVRDGLKSAMRKMFEAVCNSQEASTELEKVVKGVRKQLNHMLKAKDGQSQDESLKD